MDQKTNTLFTEPNILVRVSVISGRDETQEFSGAGVVSVQKRVLVVVVAVVVCRLSVEELRKNWRHAKNLEHHKNANLLQKHGLTHFCSFAFFSVTSTKSRLRFYFRSRF